MGYTNAYKAKQFIWITRHFVINLINGDNYLSEVKRAYFILIYIVK